MRTDQVGSDTIDLRELLAVLVSARKGDFSQRMPLDKTGLAGKIADALKDVPDLNERLSGELSRVGTVAGTEGQTRPRASVAGAAGTWASARDGGKHVAIAPVPA